MCHSPTAGSHRGNSFALTNFCSPQRIPFHSTYFTSFELSVKRLYVCWTEIMEPSALVEMDSVYIVEGAKWVLAGTRGGLIKVIAEWAQRDILEIVMYDTFDKIPSQPESESHALVLRYWILFCCCLQINVDRASRGMAISSWDESPQLSPFL